MTTTIAFEPRTTGLPDKKLGRDLVIQITGIPHEIVGIKRID